MVVFKRLTDDEFVEERMQLTDQLKRESGVNVYGNALEELTGDCFYKIESFLKLLTENNDYEIQQLGFLAEEIVYQQKRKVLNALRQVTDSIGEIEIIEAAEDGDQVTRGEILGYLFNPAPRELSACLDQIPVGAAAHG